MHRASQKQLSIQADVMELEPGRSFSGRVLFRVRSKNELHPWSPTRPRQCIIESLASDLHVAYLPVIEPGADVADEAPGQGHDIDLVLHLRSMHLVHASGRI